MKMSPLNNVIILAAICAALAILMLVADWNKELFILINSATGYDTLTTHITELGNGFIAGTVLLLLLVIQPHLARDLLVLVVITLCITSLLKYSISAPRPPALLTEHIHIIGEARKFNSFPSGHTTVAFACLGFFILSCKPNWVFFVLAFAAAALIGWSRIAVGVHWPIDVFAGAASGLLCAVASKWHSKPCAQTTNYVVAAFLAALCLLANMLEPNPFSHLASVSYVRWFFALLNGLVFIYFLACLFFGCSVLHLAITHTDFIKQRQNHLPLRFVKFGMVGSSGFVVDTTVYFVAQFFGVNHSLARIISYWVGASNNWYLNRVFTFNDVHGRKKLPQWITYLALSGCTFILNWGSYHLLTTYTTFFATYKFMAFLIGIALGVFLNFTIANMVIFSKKDTV